MTVFKKMKQTLISSVFCLLFVLPLVSFVVEGTLPPPPGKDIDPVLWKKAMQIHQEAIVIDTHCDTPMAVFESQINLGKKTDKTDVDFIKMKEGGVDAMFFAVFVGNNLDDKHPSKQALEMIDEIYNQVKQNPTLAELAFSTQDIHRIHGTGKRAILIGIENGGPLEGSMALLRDYYRLGVRYITLTHMSNNYICDSATAEKPKWNGLSPFGIELIGEMNRIGMIVDVSHISDQSFWDVLKHSKAPVFASHSCCRSLCNVPRNLTDDMIIALAKKGGIVQLNFFSSFLDKEHYNKSDEIRKQLQPQFDALKEKYKDDRGAFITAYIKLWKMHRPPDPPIEVLLDHIDYVVKLVGVDHVGLGSDYDGAGSFPRGLENVSGFPLITYHLLKRGYKEEDIKKILGGNFIRFFEQVEKTRTGLHQ